MVSPACSASRQAPAEESLLIYGGRIRTLTGGGGPGSGPRGGGARGSGPSAGDPTGPGPAVEAVGVRGGRIVALGSRSDVEAALTTTAGRRPRLFDLGGATLCPGFVDSHTHMSSFGLRLSLVDLDGVRAVEEAGRRVAEFAASLDPGGWVRGGGWNKNLWAGGAFPTRHDLDRFVPHNPVALASKDGHTWWLNTEGLRLSGVTRDTPDPPGGEIERDAAGEPTGILKENAAMYVWATVERPTAKELQVYLGKAVQRAVSLGLVGVCDMEGRESLKAYQALEAVGELCLRAWLYVPAELIPSLAAIGVERGFGGPFIKIAGVKAFLDGALGSQTADMLEPYEGSESRGIETMTAEAFSDLVARASTEGLAVAVHAIGDRANRKALDGFEAHRAVWQAAGLRHRIEHAQLLHPDDLPRLARLGLVASMQPLHAPSDRDIAERHWGTWRLATAYAWRAVAETGAVLAFGSDVPVETCDPLKGLYAAVTRRHPQEPERDPWRPEQALSPLEAVRAYTVGPAWAVGAERERGTIEVGKVADFTVLSEDILGTPDPEEAGEAILRAKALATIVGGRVAHDGR